MIEIRIEIKALDAKKKIQHNKQTDLKLVDMIFLSIANKGQKLIDNCESTPQISYPSCSPHNCLQ